MTRPRKQTVDWFPHSCSHGKTMFILEDSFGNDGYAFWFKLLEILGNSEGHYVDFSDQLTQKYISANSRISTEKTRQILDLLAELGAIDPELWIKEIIWTEHFVDGVAEVYRKIRVRRGFQQEILSETRRGRG